MVGKSSSSSSSSSSSTTTKSHEVVSELTKELIDENELYISKNPEIVNEYWLHPIKKAFENDVFPSDYKDNENLHPHVFNSLKNIPIKDGVTEKGIYIPLPDKSSKNTVYTLLPEGVFFVISHGVPLKYSPELLTKLTTVKGSKEFLESIIHITNISMILYEGLASEPDDEKNITPEESIYKDTCFTPIGCKYALSLYDTDNRKYYWIVLQIGTKYFGKGMKPILNAAKSALVKYDKTYNIHTTTKYTSYGFEERTSQIAFKPDTMENHLPLLFFGFDFEKYSQKSIANKANNATEEDVIEERKDTDKPSTIKSKRDDAINKVMELAQKEKEKEEQKQKQSESKGSKSRSKKPSSGNKRDSDLKKRFAEEKKKEKEEERNADDIDSSSDEEDMSDEESEEEDDFIEDSSSSGSENSGSDYSESESMSDSDSESDPEYKEKNKEHGSYSGTEEIDPNDKKKSSLSTRSSKVDKSSATSSGGHHQTFTTGGSVTSVELKAYHNILIKENPESNGFKIDPVKLPSCDSSIFQSLSGANTLDEIRSSYKRTLSNEEKSFFDMCVTAYNNKKEKYAKQAPPVYSESNKFNKDNDIDFSRFCVFILHLPWFQFVKQGVIDNAELDIDAILKDLNTAKKDMADLTLRVENAESNNIELNTQKIEFIQEIKNKSREIDSLQDEIRTLQSNIDGLKADLVVQTDMVKKLTLASKQHNQTQIKSSSSSNSQQKTSNPSVTNHSSSSSSSSPHSEKNNKITMKIESPVVKTSLPQKRHNESVSNSSKHMDITSSEIQSSVKKQKPNDAYTSMGLNRDDFDDML